jgi:hypothetical protein
MNAKITVVIEDFSEKMSILAEASKIIQEKAKKPSLQPRTKREENPFKRRFRWAK